MKLNTVSGVKPQFIKAATVSSVLTDKDVKETIRHADQHYDKKLD